MKLFTHFFYSINYHIHNAYLRYKKAKLYSDEDIGQRESFTRTFNKSSTTYAIRNTACGFIEQKGGINHVVTTAMVVRGINQI